MLGQSIEQAKPLGTEPGMTGRLVIQKSGWPAWWAADLHGIREVGCFPATDNPTHLYDGIREVLRWRAKPSHDDPSRRRHLRGHLVEVHVYGAERGRPVLAVSVEHPTTVTSPGTAT